MTARRHLVPDAEIARVIQAARELSHDFAELDVGRDYVRVTFPTRGGDSVAHYIGTTHSPPKAERR